MQQHPMLLPASAPPSRGSTLLCNAQRSRSSMRSNPPPKNRQRPAPPPPPPVPAEGESAETAALKARLPKSGYFALADPKSEVYSKTGQKFDPLQRGGRWKSDFIWNENWQSKLKMEEAIERKYDAALEARRQGAEGASPSPASPTPSASTSDAASTSGGPDPAVLTSQATAGTVAFSRLAQLDDIGADVTPLMRDIKEREEAQRQMQAQRQRQAEEERERVRAREAVVPLPRGDQRRLGRSNRIAKSMATTVVSTKPEDEEYKARKLAEERTRYETEKAEQRLWTACFSLLGTAASYASYGREVAISYTVGALAGLVYLRLLGKSVDGLGGGEIGGGGLGSVAGQPRLLIPLILGLAYNRWNVMYADDFGVHLNFFAILVGFLTYKIAILTKQGKDLADQWSAKQPEQQ